MLDGIDLFIAGVDGAFDAVGKLGSLPRNASLLSVAGLKAIAIELIVTERIIRDVDRKARLGVAGIHGAGNAIV